MATTEPHQQTEMTQAKWMLKKRQRCLLVAQGLASGTLVKDITVL